MTFLSTKLELTKTVKEAGETKRVPVGSVTIHTPILSAFGIEAAPALDKDGQPILDGGLPCYADAKYNWLMGAISAQVKAQARNKVKPSTADLKPGMSIATNFEELTTVAVSGAALTAIRDVKALFAKWVAGLGKSAKAQSALVLYFGSADALMVQNLDVRTKMQGYLADFMATLSADQLTTYNNYCQKLLDACDVKDDEDEAESDF